MMVNKNIFKKFILFFIIIFIWFVGSYFKLWNPFLIPPPTKVLDTFIILLKNGKLFHHFFISFIRIFSGFFIALSFSVPLAIIFGLFPKFFIYFKGVLEFLRHTPPLSLMPLIILWFGIGETSKIIIIILASFFPLFLNTFKGINSCDKKLIEVGQVFGLNKWEIFKKIIIPNAIPDILLGIKLAIGYSWRAIIGAEMIAASSGLGYLILDGQILSRIDIVVIGILSIGIFGSISDFIVEKVINKFLKRRGVDCFE
ncbi:ABC transporter permease [Fusobacterium sp.]|uniref:ABC transporter permease n=1 Tax=Fusobacterium sp. TaxID=68766 RepID=UPI002605E52B|nr:ABC transporter permease [Fusobacterium sp.]